VSDKVAQEVRISDLAGPFQRPKPFLDHPGRPGGVLILYLDTSTLVKLIRPEAGSAQIRKAAWKSSSPVPIYA
jgi:hypothetical protein